jgi:hypothetical protein
LIGVEKEERVKGIVAPGAALRIEGGIRKGDMRGRGEA